LNAVFTNIPAGFCARHPFHRLKQNISISLFSVLEDTELTVMNSAMRFAIWTASRALEIWPWLPPQFLARNCMSHEEGFVQREKISWKLTFPVQSG